MTTTYSRPQVSYIYSLFLPTGLAKKIHKCFQFSQEKKSAAEGHSLSLPELKLYDSTLELQPRANWEDY